MIRTIDEDLREACATGDETKAQVLIGQGASVNSCNKVNGWTALHWAAYRGHKGLVMYLLNKGADPTIKNVKGETVRSLLAKFNLDLLEGQEVEEASQYALPTEKDTLSSLPIVPNYIKNPEFPYISKKDAIMAPVVRAESQPSSSSSSPRLINTSPPEAPAARPQEGLAVIRPKIEQEAEAASARHGVVVHPGGVQQAPVRKVAPDNVPFRGYPPLQLAKPYNMHVSTAPSTIVSMRPSQLPLSPAHYYQRAGSPTVVHLPSQGHPPQHLAYTQQHPGQQTLVQQHPGQQPVVNPLQHQHYPRHVVPVSSEYSIQRLVRPLFQHQPAPGPMMSIGPWNYNGPPQYRPQAGLVQGAGALPPSPQIANSAPDSTQDKECTTPSKDSPSRSPSNSVNSSPSTDATIKVRVAGSEDFFEVELPDVGDSYTSLVKCFAEELDVDREKINKIRKLPNILIRKDRDVKRIKSGSEFEVELKTLATEDD